MPAEREDKRSPITIQSVERALAILEVLLRSGRGMTVLDICSEVNIQRTTSYALLNTLVAAGYVSKQPKDGKYIVTSKAYELSASYPARLPIVQYIKPRLLELGNRFHVATRIAVPNYEGRFIPVMSSGSLESLVIQSPSSTYPPHATSTGKLALSYLDDEHVIQQVRAHGMSRYTPSTITEEATLLEELHTIRQQGYAVDHAEYFPDMFCLSCPIEDNPHVLSAIITLSQNCKVMDAIWDELLPAALQCSRLLSMDISDAALSNTYIT